MKDAIKQEGNLNLQNRLTPSLEKSLLACFSAGTEIIKACPYRPSYSPFPALVELRGVSGAISRCVIKIKCHNLAAREVATLRLLAHTSLPVPKLLSTGLHFNDDEVIVLSELPGNSLAWCGVQSLEEADRTCRLVLEAVDCLHKLTARVLELEAGNPAAALPRYTLQAEYKDTLASAGPWMSVHPFQKAIQILKQILANVEEPLVFSNGDYNPLNFLCDENGVCGFVDFEGACFENPHIGFARFLIWRQDKFGWGTAAMTGLVERYLYSQSISRQDFAPILILRCLRHLIQEVSIDRSEDRWKREYMLALVNDGVQTLTRLSFTKSPKRSTTTLRAGKL